MPKILLLIDTTVTARYFLLAVRKLIFQLHCLNTILYRNTLEVAVVAYKDYDCIEHLIHQLPFTADYNRLQDFVDSLMAHGGGDEAEAVKWALNYTVTDLAELGIPDDLVILHYSDAPPHSSYNGLRDSVISREMEQKLHWNTICEKFSERIPVFTFLARSARPICTQFYAQLGTVIKVKSNVNVIVRQSVVLLLKLAGIAHPDVLNCTYAAAEYCNQSEYKISKLPLTCTTKVSPLPSFKPCGKYLKRFRDKEYRETLVKLLEETRFDWDALMYNTVMSDLWARMSGDHPIRSKVKYSPSLRLWEIFNGQAIPQFASDESMAGPFLISRHTDSSILAGIFRIYLTQSERAKSAVVDFIRGFEVISSRPAKEIPVLSFDEPIHRFLTLLPHLMARDACFTAAEIPLVAMLWIEQRAPRYLDVEQWLVENWSALPIEIGTNAREWLISTIRPYERLFSIEQKTQFAELIKKNRPQVGLQDNSAILRRDEFRRCNTCAKMRSITMMISDSECALCLYDKHENDSLYMENPTSLMSRCLSCKSLVAVAMSRRSARTKCFYCRSNQPVQKVTCESCNSSFVCADSVSVQRHNFHCQECSQQD